MSIGDLRAREKARLVIHIRGPKKKGWLKKLEKPLKSLLKKHRGTITHKNKVRK